MKKSNLIFIFKSNFTKNISDMVFSFAMLIFLIFLTAESDLKISDYSINISNTKSFFYIFINIARFFPFIYLIFTLFELSYLNKAEIEAYKSCSNSKDDITKYIFLKQTLISIFILILYIIIYNYISNTRNTLTGKSIGLFIANLQALIIFLSLIILISSLVFNPKDRFSNKYTIIKYLSAIALMIFHLFFIKKTMLRSYTLNNFITLALSICLYIITLISSYFIRRYFVNKNFKGG